jgi:hypothetical protein
MYLREHKNEFDRLVSRYMLFNQFRMEHVTYGPTFLSVSEDIITPIQFLDIIMGYKQKVAKGKPVKYNHGALIDLKDCLNNYDNRGLGDILTPNSFSCGWNYDKISVMFKYSGNLCLPFRHCTIYSAADDCVLVVDIKDTDDGTFNGTFYEFRAKDLLFQAKFEIAKKDGQWEIHFSADKYKRPLGSCVSNVTYLLDTVAMMESEVVEHILEDFAKNPLGFIVLRRAYKLIAALGCLGSYKSKTLYEVNTRSNVFIYADKDENLDEYIDERYNGCDYRKLDGWIVGGHWKLLPDEMYGVDRTGKTIKGITWVEPYKEESKSAEDIVTGEQTAKIIPNHALERAKERYGLELTNEDLDKIVEACVKGHDVTKLNVKDKFGKIRSAKSNLTGCYRLKYNKKYIDVVISRGVEAKSHRVATFLPAPKDTNCPIIDSKSYNTIKEDCCL